MKNLLLHTLGSAPAGSEQLLQSSIDNFGWIPNQSAYMAESPALLAAYQRAHDLFSACSLNEEQRAVVWITTGMSNGCHYTVQAHTFIAISKGVEPQIIHTLIERPAHLPPRLAALHRFTLAVICCQGQLGQAEIDAFLAFDYSRENMLDVVLGVSQKTMSTLLNSIAGTEIEPQFLTVNNP